MMPTPLENGNTASAISLLLKLARSQYGWDGVRLRWLFPKGAKPCHFRGEQRNPSVRRESNP